MHTLVYIDSFYYIHVGWKQPILI